MSDTAEMIEGHLALPPDPRVPEFEGYYSLRDLWPPASQERRQAMKARFTG